jgi:hypothetical protein
VAKAWEACPEGDLSAFAEDLALLRVLEEERDLAFAGTAAELSEFLPASTRIANCYCLFGARAVALDANSGARPLGDALTALLRPAGLAWRVRLGVLHIGAEAELADALATLEGRLPRGRTRAEAELDGRLCRERVSLNFPDVPLADVLQFFVDITGQNFVALPEALDGGEGPAVTLRLRDVPLATALRLICLEMQLAARIRWGAIVIGTGEGLAALARDLDEGEERDLSARLLTRQVTLNFPGTPLADVLDFLRDITGLEIVLGPGVEIDDVEVQLALRRT